MRVKNSPVTKARRKKIINMANGYFGAKNHLWKSAHEQVRHSLQYAYRDRKNNKRNFRRLWIKRISAACHQHDISYSKFIAHLKEHKILINRKMLSEMAIHNPTDFTSLVTLTSKTQKKDDKN